jgi:polyhydroxybutyrate depolymerase
MMTSLLIAAALVAPAQPEALKPGRHVRGLRWEGAQRSYFLHIPASYNPARPTPVVLALHGATMNGPIMERFTGLTEKAEEAGFIVVYPEGTGLGPVLLTWNAGAFPPSFSKRRVDDVGFLARVLDDVAALVSVDSKRVYCTGLSNGGMMAYRLAAEMSERIAAVASVAGTMVCEECAPKRAVPVLHMHGTKDTLVPFQGVEKGMVKLPTVDDTIKKWAKINGCRAEPEVAELPALRDNFKVTRSLYGGGKGGAEVVLYVIEGAGHVWPGRFSPGGFLGPTTYNIRANDLIWEFFQKHPMK